MAVPITSFYAALAFVIALGLIYWVVDGRRKGKVPIGDGGDLELMKRMRAQANFIETAPLLLVAMTLMELNGMASWFLNIFGIVLIVSRAVHPIGMTNRYPQYPFRFGGTVATIGLFGVAALALLGQALLG